MKNDKKFARKQNKVIFTTQQLQEPSNKHLIEALIVGISYTHCIQQILFNQIITCSEMDGKQIDTLTKTTEPLHNHEKLKKLNLILGSN